MTASFWAGVTLVPRRRVSEGPSRVDTVGPGRRDSASSALGFDTSSKSHQKRQATVPRRSDTVGTSQ